MRAHTSSHQESWHPEVQSQWSSALKGRGGSLHSQVRMTGYEASPDDVDKHPLVVEALIEKETWERKRLEVEENCTR